VQSAVNGAVEALQASKHRFDVAAGSLLTSAQREPPKYMHVSEWIDGCQSYCMGNLVWRQVPVVYHWRSQTLPMAANLNASLATGRYGVNKCKKASDGSLEFEL
jgi:hypothetical protein